MSLGIFASLNKHPIDYSLPMPDSALLSPSAALRLDARALAKHYGKQQAVNGVDLQLAAGDVLGLLGVNGAGKSTTLNMLTGNIIPQMGSVNICGADLQREPIRAKQSMGYLPETAPLYPELTVDEYLTLAAALHGVKKTDIKHALEKTKQRCGLDNEGSRLIGKLSKGYQQRVGIAQAIVHSPAVIILDEPTVGLDPNQSNQMRELIKQLGRESSVIFSSHILSDIEAVCSRVAILHQGKIALDEPLQDFAARHDASLETIFLRMTSGSPA
jgi:ABC-2 type transport system ATP-binding protein